MKTHAEYVEALKSSAISTGKKVLIGAVSKKLPFLFLPVLGPIVSFLLGKVVEILVQETEFAIYFKYIDLRVDKQGREFSEAAMRNFNAQKSGDADAKAQSEKELIEKFKAFVVLGN
jgi:hypothetical protein